ncbi:MAG: class II fructose-bisphosphate aldolase, partial [Eubacteriales bacterium]
PAINVFDIESINGVLAGLAEAKSDGIIQISTGGGAHASGATVKDSVLGAITLANHVHLVASRYNINVALHTDHCQADKVDTFLMPLIEETERRRAAGLPNLFNSHMFDGSALPHAENIKLAAKILERCAKNDIVLEVEAGVVGGEEDGVNTENVHREKLYTTPEDMYMVEQTLGKVGGKYTLAATFGNVHGVYKPGNVQLNPKILKAGQEYLQQKDGADAHYLLVFHGGSGSPKEDIEETLQYGVVKMNIDTDTQYAFTRPVAAHMFTNYDGVLKVDGEVGVKKVYDPRSYLKKGEAGITARVVEACNDLHSAGKTLCK